MATLLHNLFVLVVITIILAISLGIQAKFSLSIGPIAIRSDRIDYVISDYLFVTLNYVVMTTWYSIWIYSLIFKLYWMYSGIVRPVINGIIVHWFMFQQKFALTFKRTFIKISSSDTMKIFGCKISENL
eukprot:UN01522